MKEKRKGLVGRLYGVAVLPETTEEWLEFVESQIDQAVARERERIVKKAEEEKNKWNGSGEYYANVTEALDDLINSIREDRKEQDGTKE